MEQSEIRESRRNTVLDSAEPVLSLSKGSIQATDYLYFHSQMAPLIVIVAGSISNSVAASRPFNVASFGSSVA